MDTIRLFKVLIFKALKFDNNEVVDNSNSKLNEKLSKFKKLLVLKYVFNFFRLVFTHIWIETKAAYFLEKWFFEIFITKLMI